MWFTFYAVQSPHQLDIYNPISSVYFLLQETTGVRLLAYRANGQPRTKHWFQTIGAAQRHAATCHGVPMGMWVDSFDIHPLESSPARQRSQLRHLARCTGQALRPASVIDYAIHMSYEPRELLETFAEVRDMVRDQVPYAQRRAHAQPYIRQALLLRESRSHAARIYRMLTLVDEATARQVINEELAALQAAGALPA